MSVKDDSYEMLDLGPKKSKASVFIIIGLILLLTAAAVAAYAWQQRMVKGPPPVPVNNSIAELPPASTPVASTPPAPIPIPTKAVPTPVNIVINFDSDSAVIVPGQLAKLQALAELIKDTPGTMQISAYTDALGSPERGQVLSEYRAQVVMTAIKAAGANAQIKYNLNWYGELYPVASNTSEAGRALNRRVEIYFAPAPK